MHCLSASFFMDFTKSTQTRNVKINLFHLRILTGKKHFQIKLQCLRKVWIWIFGWLVLQINSLKQVLIMKRNFQTDEVVTGKTPLFVIGPFCIHHSICLNIGF